MWMSCGILTARQQRPHDRQTHRAPAAASPSRRAGCGPRRPARSRRAGPALAATDGDT